MDLRADIEPTSNFGGDGLLSAIEPLMKPGLQILRLRSDKAGTDLADAMRRRGATVDDCVLYHNEPTKYESMPDFDAVFFASASAVEVFDKQWGVGVLADKTVAVIGNPTLAALKKRGVRVDLVGPEATVDSCLTALAGKYANETLMLIKEKTS